MKKIINPVLRGFNPDPSIIRVGDDYYIATSTFEWFPGVQIHHSKDLINWELVAHPLKSISQLDMRGIPSSGGIWAPCLSYSDGVFYLIYTIQKSAQAAMMDAPNYLVTTTDIYGDWSEPVYLHSRGFDPSLFHDDDGKKWLIWATWDHRKGKDYFGGIGIQEYNSKLKKLEGNAKIIYNGTKHGAVEGPHLYKRKGYYYMMAAQGGTYTDHCETIARSKNLFGPYEFHPQNPLITSADAPEITLQRAGHGSLVETQNGEWYMAHLCGRPYQVTLEDAKELNFNLDIFRGACVLGRETALQKFEWLDDDWIYMSNKSQYPDVEVDAPDLPEHKFKVRKNRDDFDNDKLDINFQTLRKPFGEDTITLKERPGYLRIKGKESLFSKFENALVARRQQAFDFVAETCIEFEPTSFQQMAGLVYMYNEANHYYLKITHDDEKGKVLELVGCHNKSKRWTYFTDEPICIEGWTRCYMRLEVQGKNAQFSYSEEGKKWNNIGLVVDTRILSDESVNGWSFTGAFIGLCCQDITGQNAAADFDYFEYTEK